MLKRESALRACIDALAFSCERTCVNYERTTMVGAFVCGNGVLASMRENSHLFRQSSSEMIPLPLEIVAGLQIQPESLSRAEVPREPQCAIRTNGPGAVHDLIDPSRRHTDIPRQPVLRQAQRLEEIRGENFARMNGLQLASGHVTLSLDTLVIADDLNLVGVAVLPAKADAPLLVHANTVLATPLTPELLQSIARRHAQIAELLGRIHRHQLAQLRALKIRRIPPDGLASEQSLGVAIGEGVDHEA